MLSPDLQLSSYDYALPPECIAQNPAVPRDHSRLLVMSPDGLTQHHHFYDLADLLQAGDLLVLNNTKVIPARLYGHKISGPPRRKQQNGTGTLSRGKQAEPNSAKSGPPNQAQVKGVNVEGAKVEGAKVEVLLLEERLAHPRSPQWLALVKPGRRLKPGAEIQFGGGELPQLQSKILTNDPATGGRIIQFNSPETVPFWDCLAQLGEMPLPPYITHSTAQNEQYQTIYGKTPGAVAAPTAGLHFTPDLFNTLEAKGIERAFVTLHVGVGTFRPVEAEVITDHQMHGEWVEVPPTTVEQIQATRARGGRVIAVGTTAVRSLEGAAQSGSLAAIRDKVNLFIYPGYQWRVVDGLITNFHLPKSSLMMLVSAMTGRDRLLATYREAITSGYRFYSFGDAMLILPHPSSLN